MDILKVCPLQASYTVNFGVEVVRQQLAGGLGRYRRRILGASHTVNVSWVLTPDQYQYLQAFYRIRVRKAGEAFLCKLIIDNAPVQYYEALFLPGTFNLTGKSGRVYFMSAQLEVKAKAADEGFDQIIVDMYDAGLGNSDLNILEKLVNVDSPNIVPD